MIAFGWIVMCLWPVVSITLFRKYSLPFALCITILGGNMLLPSGLAVDLPFLPPLTKYSITVILALILTAIFCKNRADGYQVLPGWLPRNRLALTLIIILFLGIVGTVLTNSDQLVYGWRVIQGIRPYDIITETANQLILMIPLFLARKVLHSPEGQRALLITLIVASLLYTVPALYEVRMSPQLHNQIYGFRPWSFIQQMRAGGFRPVVFLSHGLELALFMACAAIAVAGMIRVVPADQRPKWLLALGWFSVILVLCKSFGAMILALVFVPVALFMPARTQLLVIVCCATLFMMYPILRAAHLIPVDQMLTAVQSVDPERAASLGTRFYHEDQLLAKAQERPLFGWGGWSRSRVFSEQGLDVSITDGAWVGLIGKSGWVGYIGLFGLLCLPAFVLFFSRREKIDYTCTTIALIHGALLLDLIPNAGSATLYYLVAGALLGRLETTSDMLTQHEGPQQAAPLDNAQLGYTRQAAPRTRQDASPKYARTFPPKDARSEQDRRPEKTKTPSTSRPRGAKSRYRS